MFRKLALLALVLTACSVSPTQEGENQEAIVGGKTDTTDTSVVMVYAAISSTEGAICSGEVVSPHMVLTAAHCVDPATLGTSTAKFVIYLGDTLANDMEAGDPTNVVQVASTDFDQAFDPNNLPAGHDVGEVTTTTAIPRTVLPVNQTALPQSDVGATIKLVGFGITSGSDSMGTTAGTRRTVSTKITSIVDDKLLNFGTSKVGTCEGDSGGPAFMTISGVSTIVGITSYGPEGCNAGSTDTLVDAYYSSFILPHITAAESGATTDMATSSSSSDAATSGTADLATTSTSSGSQDMSVASSGGNSSDASTTTGTPGSISIGGACDNSEQCQSGICTLGSQHYCTESCSLENASTCPGTMKCENVGGAPYCVWPSKASGCSASAAGSANTAPASALGGIALLLAIALFLRFVPRRP